MSVLNVSNEYEKYSNKCTNNMRSVLKVENLNVKFTNT